MQAILEEECFDGPMPDEIWALMHTRAGAEDMLRATVRRVQLNIIQRLRSNGGSQTVSRPFEQQSPLERNLRALLWQPQDQLASATAALPGHVKRKEYRDAANCQDRIHRAQREIAQWTQLLELYEAELGTKTAQPIRETHPAEADAGNQTTKGNNAS